MIERWQQVADFADVNENGKLFAYREGPFEESGILIRCGGEIRAWRNLCRHLAVRLDGDRSGELMDRERRHLVCQRHGAVYRAEDGLCIAGPCAGSRLKPLQVRIESGAILLDTAALGGFLTTPASTDDA